MMTRASHAFVFSVSVTSPLDITTGSVEARFLVYKRNIADFCLR